MNAEELLRQAELAKIRVLNEIVRRKELNMPLGHLYTMVNAYNRDIKTYKKILKR